jgi:hypothetical protein
MMASEEKLREVIESFTGWVSCHCADCRADCHSHAINEDASLSNLADYVISELKKDTNDKPRTGPS